jgi:hypothetical protein
MECEQQQTGGLLSTLICINIYLVTVSIIKLFALEMLEKARTFNFMFC